MFRKIIVLVVLIFSSWVAYADTVSIDTNGWTQEQKNMMQAAAVSLLAQEDIAYKAITVSENSLEIDNPSSDVSHALTSKELKTEVTKIIDTAEQNRQIEIAEATAKANELKSNELSTLDITQVDDRIDSLNSLNDVKDLLKELLKYIKAKE